MLLPRIIPCLDFKDGRVVKGVRFQGLRDAGDPVALAEAYAQNGADELVMLDVSATPEGRGNALETVRAVRRVLSIPLTVGGGVRKLEDGENLLEAGADPARVSANGRTAAQTGRAADHPGSARLAPRHDLGASSARSRRELGVSSA